MVKDKKLNLAVVGLGVIAEHYNILLKSDRFNLCGVCDTNENCKCREMFKDIPFYNDMDKMFNELDLDVVVLSVPLKLHKSLAIKAMEHHVNVLIEKPMADNLEDLKDIYDCADANGVIVKGMFHWQFADEIHYLKHLLPSFGKIEKITVNIKDDYASDNCVIRQDRRVLAGSWRDSGINALSYISKIWSLDGIKEKSEGTEFKIDEVSKQDYYSKHVYDLNGIELTVIIDWSTSSRDKITTIETDIGEIIVNHSEQAIYAGKKKIYEKAVLDRLTSHYENLFSYIRIDDKSRSNETKLIELLYQGEKNER